MTEPGSAVLGPVLTADDGLTSPTWLKRRCPCEPAYFMQEEQPEREDGALIGKLAKRPQIGKVTAREGVFCVYSLVGYIWARPFWVGESMAFLFLQILC